MEDITLSPTYWWLVIGVICIGVEAFAITGIGFFFAGLAAFVLSIVIHMGWVSDHNIIAQTGVFSLLTFAFALLLWKPLKKWRTTSSSGKNFDNIIGDTATVGEDGLRAGEQGKVRWSGTTMFAALSADSAVSELAKGSMVEIMEVKGNMLIVKPMGE